MELTPNAIHRAILPTAAFVDSLNNDALPSFSFEPKDAEQVPWQESVLNPKNRVDSLDEVLNPKWRIDGCSGLGTQFFTIPLFFKQPLVPMRIDTFIPEWDKCPAKLREVLDLATAFHTKDTRVTRLGISRHILRTLEYWTSQNPEFEAIYLSLPFGSRIVLENIEANIRDIRLKIVKTHYLERQFQSRADLQRFWGDGVGAWPELIDIGQVQLCRQLHDSVSLVRVQGTKDSQILVMKALTSYSKYIYHELKLLLSMQQHPNIISRPRHVVTKRCRFGGNIAILGFTTPYHSLGTLRDILPFRRIHGSLHFADQLRWATQLTSALRHIQDHGRYYSDLRLDNILLSDANDLVMVDFEQRGVWCGFASPELNSLDYVFMLATDPNTTDAVRERYEKLLENHIPNYKAMLGNEYWNSEHGFAIPWSGLVKCEVEAAEVFMLGRVLWCIFEGQSCPEIAVWQSYQIEADLEFPTYRNTPQEMRDLIDRCIASEKSVSRSNKGGVARKGNQLILKHGNAVSGAQAVQAEATRWWREELQQAESFLNSRLDARTKGCWNPPVRRPSLGEVLEVLESFSPTYKEAL